MFKPRYYQVEAVNSIFNYFRHNSGNPVIAMPTGTGKSLVIADFVRQVFKKYPNQRIMMLTHVKELIEQNSEKLQTVWSTAPLGIYSAGLNSRDTILPIVFGGVQSVSNGIKRSLKNEVDKPEKNRHFGWRDLIIIDECHLISPSENTQYQYVIRELKKINPSLKVIGLTATPYRLKDGMITSKGGLFTDICYDITQMNSFNRLVDEGFLAPLIPKQTHLKLDVSGVKIKAGEYDNNQLQEEVDIDKTTLGAVREIIEWGEDRKSWLLFASGVDHAEHIAETLRSLGVTAEASHSKLKKEVNSEIIRKFKAGEIRALVNNNKYTTGFDHPAIDLIGMLRPTTSPGLWVQMLGRGTRPSPETGKTNCLVLDFAGNTARLGPINDPVKPKKAGESKGEGTAPVRICKACGTYNHASARFCDYCGAEFPRQSKLRKTASTEELIKVEHNVVKYFEVKEVSYSLHEKRNEGGVLTSPASMRVTYYAGLRTFSEWVCFEHSGFAGKKARDWWRQRDTSEPPITTHEGLKRAKELRKPERIRVLVSAKYPEILGVEY